MRLPLDTERHRRWPDLFIVGIAHGDGDTIVGVADHFLVVQANDADVLSDAAPRASRAQLRRRFGSSTPSTTRRRREILAMVVERIELALAEERTFFDRHSAGLALRRARPGFLP